MCRQVPPRNIQLTHVKNTKPPRKKNIPNVINLVPISRPNTTVKDINYEDVSSQTWLDPDGSVFAKSLDNPPPSIEGHVWVYQHRTFSHTYCTCIKSVTWEQSHTSYSMIVDPPHTHRAEYIHRHHTCLNTYTAHEYGPICYCLGAVMIYLEESGDNFNDMLNFMASELQTHRVRMFVCLSVCAHVDGRITDIVSDTGLCWTQTHRRSPYTLTSESHNLFHGFSSSICSNMLMFGDEYFENPVLKGPYECGCTCLLLNYKSYIWRKTMAACTEIRWSHSWEQGERSASFLSC